MKSTDVSSKLVRLSLANLSALSIICGQVLKKVFDALHRKMFLPNLFRVFGSKNRNLAGLNVIKLYSGNTN
jgi:hypothetical protein